MRIGLLGGLTVEHDGRAVAVTGSMQLAVLFRLAIDAGSAVSYRAIAEDVWGLDAPENSRAALQSIVSRLRSQLPSGTLESTPGGYRLVVARADVDALVFADLVAAASGAGPAEAVRLASDALTLWAGEPWVPSANFDWFERDLRRDRSTALELGGRAGAPGTAPTIPVPISGFVGREEELELIAEQLAASRLVTIVGTGGAGKTRLAVETAAGIRGSILVELAPVGPRELYAAVLAASGRDVRTVEAASESSSTKARVLEALVGRPTLLVLDNCEHVIDEAARLAEDLLSALPMLQILATSREPLGVGGEAFVNVGPLDHPTESAIASSSSDELAEYAAIALFCQRALAARGAPLDDDELVVAAHICARLDGLPLALELAAAKLRTMAPDEVLAGLDDRFALLTGGFRTALPRHQTLRAMIDWSWSLLSADERTALARLAVFPAGIDASDARRVSASMGLRDATVFDALVDRSLLQRARGRYRALETIREYGIEKLAETGQAVDAREAQVRYLVERAKEFDRLLRGPRIHEAITWFDAEDDNISAALRYSTTSGMAGEAIDLTTGCGWYWTIRDRSEDARTWFTVIGPLAEGVDSDEATIVRMIAPITQAFSSNDQRDPEELTRDAIGALSQLDLVSITAGGNELLQVLPVLLRAFAAAGREEGWMLGVRLPSGEELGLDPWPTAVLHVVAAAMAQNRGDFDVLGDESTRAVDSFTQIGDIWGLALAQQMRAEWLVLAGELDAAFAMTEESTANMRRITTSWDLAQQQGLAISILMRRGDIAGALERSNAVLHEAEETGNARALLQASVTAASISLASGDLATATTHLERYDELAYAWPTMPGQMVGWAESARAGIAIEAGELPFAEISLRKAVDAAVASNDHPVIGAVALELGHLALARGNVGEAVRALDLSTAIIGTYDATFPMVVRIEKAAADLQLDRTGTEVPTRSMAVEALKELL